ncbi:MAG: hypothetical protein E7327_06560 [Clostridiales bacterium]|nr:hypothetical protein [Clostridiales bacterium]
MKRWICGLLSVLLMALLPVTGMAETAPASLRRVQTVEEAEAFLLYPPEDGVTGVQAGYIRLVSQQSVNDPMFRAAYWQGSVDNDDFDLTRRANRYGYPYPFHAGNMCTRAAYSMALSYLGVDAAPGEMSVLTGVRDMDQPYDEVSELVGVERVEAVSDVFDTLMDNYLYKKNYSPVYIYIRKPDGQLHALLVIAKLKEPSSYLVLDSSGMWLHGKQHRIYSVVFNRIRTEIINGEFRTDFAGSQVLRVYQWRLMPEKKGR